ncbi:phosphate ABC transporter, periplasmic phosphate- binding protein [Cellulomonas flavigena DSM 20109]|uniref:Phosphate-binding protein n=1 Tax=Cellulomonas flavigena (strain ATCC 482 / DSM 20109 / BCRC 11376 / JCM 18109 / NBRC 3775 / NCIMB 8073 / NRS 134) TaxID=446466 RepID=D5UJ47_CELFN|nr:phosphate ABC transporter substrate-binding protein PstS [Cellulomonas flavigena]ADG73570.1 phosphate ABC transporter, periplasmic phosphate- binding protein [Cellulomonas flavigena DSM 20109]
MKLTPHSRIGAIALTGALALTLAACSSGSSAEPGATSGGDSAELSGSLAGAGATSQEKAVAGWIAGFNDLQPGVTVSYDAVGSGGGREQFLAGAVQFAGSDAALKEDELEQAVERCEGGEAIELPLYISPIAVVYNLPDLDAEHLNLSAATIAKIFNRDITTWDDAAIAAENPDVTLPSLDIIPVNRSDESGTTENFTEYLEAASEGAWPHEASGDWPLSGGQSGNGTQGVLDTVTGAEGAITYVDASRAGDLGTVALKVGDEYVPFSAEAAAAVVDASPRAEGATDKRLVVELDRTTTAAGAYPLVLISYSLACSTYADEADAANVKAYLSYVASEAGQERAADPSVAGAAPISDDLRAEVQAAIDSITAG